MNHSLLIQTIGDIEEDVNEFQDWEWDRFLHHAKRVRELSITLERTERDKPLFVYYDCYDILEEHCPDEDVLPNLRKITADVGRVEWFLPTLFQPRLESCTWTYRDADDAIELLEGLWENVPFLRELSMREDDWSEANQSPPRVRKKLWKTIRALPELRSVDVNALSHDTLRNLAARPHFESLAFYLQDVDYGTVLAQLSPVFPSLKELNVRTSGAKMGPLLSLLSALPSRGLVSVTIKFDRFRGEPRKEPGEPENQPTAQDIHDVAAALARIQTLQSVTLRWDIFHPNVEDAAVYDVSEASLRPLFAVGGLQHVTLANAPTAFSAAGLEELARAWAGLRSLDLGHDCYGCDRGLFAVCDLAVFGAHCPTLGRLAVRVAPSAGCEEAGTRGGASRLTELVMKYEGRYEEGSKEVAATLGFVARAFPRARTEMEWKTVEPAVAQPAEKKPQKPARDCPCGFGDCKTDLYPVLGSLALTLPCWNMCGLHPRHR